MTRKITPPAELAAFIASHRAASLDDVRTDLRVPAKVAATFGPFPELPPGTYAVNDDGTLSPKETK